MANWQASLRYALINGDLARFRKWLEQGRQEDPAGDVINTFRGRRGESLLLMALEFDRIEILADLLEQGADVTATDKSGRTALHYALSMNETAGLELLLPLLDSSVTDRSGFTPLMTCAYGSAVDRRPYLLEHIRVLFKSYRDLDARNNAGKSALELACEVGFREAAELLIAHGADVHQTLQDGSSLLHAASQHGHQAVMNLLLDACIPVDAQDCQGRSALRWALDIPTPSRRRDAVALLVGAGANPRLVANDSKCPEDFAETYPELREVFDAGRAKNAIDAVLRKHRAARNI